MADDIKRLNYFTNQFLEQTDFQAEQAYHRRMRHLHNQRLHTPGVAYGLAVSKKGDREVTIAEGMAVDADGREIVVLEGGLSYTLTTTELNKSIYLSVVASDVDVDPYKGVGFTDRFTRKAERPKFLETAAFTPTAIVLATLRLDATGKIVDVNTAPAERRVVSAAIAPSTITLDQLSPSIRPIVSVDGVSNPGGNVDLLPANAITVTPNNATKQIAIGETHSARTDNPHSVTAAQTGALPLGGGTLSGRLAATQDISVGLFGLPQQAGRVSVAGPSAEFSFVRRSLTSWPATTAAGDRFVWYNSDGNARLWTEQRGDLLTVTNAGNIGMGVPTPAFRLDVNGRMRIRQVSTGDATAGIWFSRYYRQEFDAAFVGMKSTNEVGFWGNTGLAGWRLFVNTDNGRLSITGDAFKPGGGPWGSSCDERLKDNIRPLPNALDRLLKLRGVLYEWKQPETQGNLTGPQIGLIAQEVEEVFPSWVGVDSAGYKTVTIRGFEALTVEAFKQLNAENEQLKLRCETLEARLEELEKRFQVMMSRTGGLADAKRRSP